MDAPKIVEFLKSLRCENIRVKERWVECSCPLARWTHSKAGTDTHPSFGVAIEPGASSRWRCHGCNRGGTLVELLWMLKRYDDKAHTQDFAMVRMNDGVGVSTMADVKERIGQQLEEGKAAPTKGWYSARKPPGEVAQALEPLPESDLHDHFLPIVASSDAGKYLLGPKRRIGPRAWESWGLCWHPTARRIGVPIRDYKGRLMGITGRAIGDSVKKRWLHSTGFRRDYVLFGEDHFVEHVRTAIVVEGNFDTIYLWQHGYLGAAGVMGSYISPYQLQQFRKFFDKAVIFRDGDDPGKEAADRWLESLSTCMPTTLAAVENGRDPDQYSPDELLDILGPPPSGQPPLTTLD